MKKKKKLDSRYQWLTQWVSVVGIIIDSERTFFQCYLMSASALAFAYSSSIFLLLGNWAKDIWCKKGLLKHLLNILPYKLLGAYVDNR